MGAPEDEARIAAIVAEGRATRRRPSRALWLAAAIVGAVCAIGFALLIVPDGAPDGAAAPDGTAAPGRVPAPAPARRAGCAGGFGGFGLGLGLGVAIGFALAARRRGGGGQGGAGHSSRRSP